MLIIIDIFLSAYTRPYRINIQSLQIHTKFIISYGNYVYFSITYFSSVYINNKYIYIIVSNNKYNKVN